MAGAGVRLFDYTADDRDSEAGDFRWDWHPHQWTNATPHKYLAM